MASQPNKVLRSSQSTQQLETLIQEAKVEKNSVPMPKRLSFCQSKLKQLDADFSEINLIKSAIWLNNLMAEICRSNSPNQKIVESTRRISEKIYTLIESNLDETDFTRLQSSYLAISAKLRDQNGDYWGAAWDLESANRLTLESASKLEPFRQVAEAQRMLRLGFGNTSTIRLEKLRSKLNGVAHRNVSLALAKAYRLMGREQEAEDIRAEIEKSEEITSNEVKEIKWERGCSKMAQLGRCDEVVGLVGSGKPFFDADYYPEAVLWARAFGDEVWLNSLPAVSYVRKISSIGLKSSGYLRDALSAMHDCDQSVLSTEQKIRLIGTVVSKKHQVNTLDKEQLIIVASCRILLKLGADRLAALTLAQYRAMSLQVSRQQCEDHLGIGKDLVTGVWFKDYR